MPVPTPGSGEVLVHVRAAGVNALDGKIRTGSLTQAFPLALPATLGIELAGEVVHAAEDLDPVRFAPGTRVFAALGRLGAYADYVAVPADQLVHVPEALDLVTAASLPVASLTAWQALMETGGLRSGETVLIHGAAGGVGGFAVQFAKRAGARVLATARASNAEHVRALGAEQVIEPELALSTRGPTGVDLVLDLVGGETLAGLWRALSPAGRIVSTCAPDIEARVPPGGRGVWFTMRPDARRLAQVAQEVAEGRLVGHIGEVLDRGRLVDAIERRHMGHRPAGKSVVRMN
ncbi:NADP-dependent oxidoreductase [Aquabacterium sp. A7-Y]|nr:NADP-dependent oxidoreductase [Aquabacterium sp. A7-Y]